LTIIIILYMYYIMSLDTSDDICKIIRTGNPNGRPIRLPDGIAKLSEAELLNYLNDNKKEIIDGVIDTLKKCGIIIKINKNKNELIFESPGYYTSTYNVKTGKIIKTNPFGFGSSKPRFSGGKKITKKNRKNLKHFKKNIHGMVMNGGDLLTGLIKCLAYSCVVVVGFIISIPYFAIKWTYEGIYNLINGNPNTVVVTNTDVPIADLGDVHDNAIYAEAKDNGVPEVIAQVVPGDNFAPYVDVNVISTADENKISNVQTSEIDSNADSTADSKTGSNNSSFRNDYLNTRYPGISKEKYFDAKSSGKLGSLIPENKGGKPGSLIPENKGGKSRSKIRKRKSRRTRK
jgi:hypothetical protein